MTLLGRTVAVAIPDTVLEERESLRDKTNKLGVIARACSIYGVDAIEVFRDDKGRGEAELIVKVLGYLETPQYLRRRLYPLDEELRYAGTLPPLRIPSHKSKVKVDELRVGEAREGVANGDGSVDVGLEQAVVAGARTAKGRVTVRLKSKFPLTGEVIPREQAGKYWGYTVRAAPAGEVFAEGWLRIATSRLGSPFTSELARLRASIHGSQRVKLVFGSPARGLFDIFGRELQRSADFVVNLIPDQQVVSVRTEEAIFAGLGLLDVLSADKA